MSIFKCRQLKFIFKNNTELCAGQRKLVGGTYSVRGAPVCVTHVLRTDGRGVTFQFGRWLWETYLT